MTAAQLAKAEQEDMHLREIEASACLAGLIGGFIPVDIDSDDEDYVETPSPGHFPIASHDHEVGASGKSVSERTLSVTEQVLSMQKQLWQFQQEQVRKNTVVDEMHASLIKSRC